MTMLARNATGLRNLFALSSLASVQGRYKAHDTRMDRELIAERADGIIATTGCPGGSLHGFLELAEPQPRGGRRRTVSCRSPSAILRRGESYGILVTRIPLSPEGCVRVRFRRVRVAGLAAAIVDRCVGCGARCGVRWVLR